MVANNLAITILLLENIVIFAFRFLLIAELQPALMC